MKKVLILVEGQTEETFVRDVLAPHLLGLGVCLVPVLVVTKRVKSGGSFKGGVVSYGKLAQDIRRLLKDTSATWVTTMVDFYGVPEDFPGRKQLPAGDCYARVAHLEKEFRRDIDSPRFLPYLALHEFEALLFADPEKCSTVFPERTVAPLLEIRASVQSPEEINEGTETAPSKRIVKVFQAYQKPLHGPQALKAIGLQKVRTECRHFNAWLSTIERT